MDTKELIEKIANACYHIPGKYLQDCSTGEASIYSQGLIAGRKQCLDMISNACNAQK